MSPSNANRQPDLLPRSKCPTIPIAEDHKLVQLTDTLDWTEMEDRAQQIRASKLKNAAGRPPHLRASLGAMLLMATRRLTYREAEDLIRYYAPARYLCGLTETEWTPDFTTIQDFTELMAEEGIKLINQQVVQRAVKEKLADPTTLVADTTAQEASIPYPNEMGLMAGFLTSVASAARKVGRGLKGFVQQTASQFKAARQKAREYRLFAKTKESKDRVMKQIAAIVEKLNDYLGKALGEAAAQRETLHKYGIVAKAKLVQLQDTMGKLLPQIRYWIRTGYVASGKIINLHIPQLYSIVRGKVGKPVEFGLSWGITRLARVPAGHAGPGSPRVGGHEVRAASGQRPHRALWQGAASLCLRSWWIQRAERLRLEEVGGQGCGAGPPWTYPVVGKRSGAQAAGRTEGTGGSGNRHHQEFEVRVQPSLCTLCLYDGGRADSARCWDSIPPSWCANWLGARA
jgi:molybdopterin converting factor small subunit